MVRSIFITANVGSVFENLETGLNTWMNEFCSVIRSRDPEFVAVHFQETGGKNYTNGCNSINVFFGRLMDRMSQMNYGRAEGFVDSRSDLQDQYTALGSAYFVHESVPPTDISIWDFQDQSFNEVSHSKLHIGSDLDATNRKQKEKFPQHYHPNSKWSRKGFIRTRWLIQREIIDLVNIHLFHDSDNLIAASAFPSEFAQSREKALKYTLERLESGSLLQHDKSSMFVFGDFNFRMNTQGVMTQLKGELKNPENNLQNDLNPTTTTVINLSKSKCMKPSESEVTGVSLGTKKFNCPDHELRFLHSFDWLKKYDFELKQLGGALQELELNFHPSYPFEENSDEPEKFLRTRCPAWCDRVLFTNKTRDIISQDAPIEYNVIGSKAFMGDHKPVFLSFSITSAQSTTSEPSHHKIHNTCGSTTKGINTNPTPGESSGTVVVWPSSKKSLSESSFVCSINSNSLCNGGSTTDSNADRESSPSTSTKRCNCLVSFIKCNLKFSRRNVPNENANSAGSPKSVSKKDKSFDKKDTKSKPTKAFYAKGKLIGWTRSKSNLDNNKDEIDQDPDTETVEPVLESALSRDSIQIEPLIPPQQKSNGDIRCGCGERVSNNKPTIAGFPEGEQLIIPIPLETDVDSKIRDLIQLPVNIQNLNVISSKKDCSCGVGEILTNPSKKSSDYNKKGRMGKLHFTKSWTRGKIDKEDGNSCNSKVGNAKSKKKSAKKTTLPSSRKSLLCGGCIVS